MKPSMRKKLRSLQGPQIEALAVDLVSTFVSFNAPELQGDEYRNLIDQLIKISLDRVDEIVEVMEEAS